MSEVEKALKEYHERRQRGRPRVKGDSISSKVRSVYIPEEIQFIWGKFQKICKREGKSVSEAIVEYVCDYVTKHDPGNPQMLMTSFGEGGATTMSNIEGRVRQLCMESMNHKMIEWIKIIQIIHDNDVGDGSMRVAMATRVSDWLREKGYVVMR